MLAPRRLLRAVKPWVAGQRQIPEEQEPLQEHHGESPLPGRIRHLLQVLNDMECNEVGTSDGIRQRELRMYVLYLASLILL